jgi:hypothetical protein
LEQDMMGWFSAVIERRTLLGWAIVAIVGAIATVTMLALAVPSFAYHEEIDPKDNKEVNKKLNELRKATDKYRVLSYSEGQLPATIVDPDDPTNVYVRPSRCVQMPPLGPGGGPAMGYHYVNQADVNRNLGDGKDFAVGVEGNYLKPEALLYGLSGTDDPGELKLVAVEWIVRSADQKDIDPTNDEPQQEHPQLQLTEKTSVPFHNEKAPMWGHEGWPGSPYHGELAGQDQWQPIHYDLHAWIWEENPTGMFQDFNRNVSCP